MPVLLWLSAARLMDTQTVDAQQREVLRCAHCHLVQFRTQNNLCRRCWAALDLPPVVEAAQPTPAPEPADESPNVAQAIRALRSRQGLSQRELAQRMNVPRTYVSKIENDKATPTIASLERLAGAMQTDVATILRSTGSGIPEDRVRELMSDTFISQLIPFVPKLAPGQMNHVLSELRIMASRFASGGRAVMGPR